MKQKFKCNVPVYEMRQRLLSFSAHYPHFAILDSCPHTSFKSIPVKYEMIAGFGTKKYLSVNQNCLGELNYFLNDKAGDWKFGILSYDLKNEIEHLTSSHPDSIQFPMLHFFIPEVIITLKGGVVEIKCPDGISAANIFQQLITDEIINSEAADSNVEFELPSSAVYCKIIEKIKYHLLRGDIYEMSFCIHLIKKKNVDPLTVYKRLTDFSPSPFSCFARINEHYLMCASPERFIGKEGTRIISQPMKGTSKRSDDKTEDNLLKLQLEQSEKERAENVMIVDLVRNDLSRIAKKGSVKVDELFGVYTFPKVHQMVSTVSAELREEISFAGIIKAMFPMGSMTGAPKVRAMQLIEEYENFKRGIFSGSAGYIDPEGDFDFNVIIRSIIYNSKTNQLSIPVGSAITAKSDAMQEYHECILKAQGMLNALGMTEALSTIKE